MAYSDYGGYAFLNGERVIERSDATIYPGGKLDSTPGQYPGWFKTLEQRGQGEDFHVVLGDENFFVGMHKQSYVVALHNGKRTVLEVPEDIGEIIEKRIASGEHVGYEYKIDDYTISVFWVETDNHYVFVELVMTNDDVWTGFSGYGVGAGLDDGCCGYSTEAQVSLMWELFNV